MSQWTHINAVIRFDAIRPMGMKLPDLGKTTNFNSDPDEWDKCTVPCGSEGSMQYQVWEDDSGTNSLAAYTVMFWGDLRDYSDVKEIMDYFEKITTGQMIRSGLLEVDVEGDAPITYRYDGEKREWIRVIQKL